MPRSPLNEALRAARRRRERAMRLDELSARARDLAEQGIRDYAATHGLTYGDARRRLRAAMRDGRTATRDPGDG